MYNKTVEDNAHQLWFSTPYSYFAKEDSLKEISPICNCLIGRIIFIIVDFFTNGNESKKVHDAALATLKGMQEQLDEKDLSRLRFHFNEDISEESYPGCPVSGHTYRELAQKLLERHPLGKYDDIKDEAQKLIDKFDALPLFAEWEPLTKQQIISQAVWSHREIGDPSVSEKELRVFQERLRKNPGEGLTSIVF
jgi:hypothetical protein